MSIFTYAILLGMPAIGRNPGGDHGEMSESTRSWLAAYSAWLPRRVMVSIIDAVILIVISDVL